MLSKRGPKPLLLVADTPPEGLMPNSGRDRSAVPNNHLAYAVHWFSFAGLAVLIYLLALRRRGRVLVTPPTRGCGPARAIGNGRDRTERCVGKERGAVAYLGLSASTRRRATHLSGARESTRLN